MADGHHRMAAVESHAGKRRHAFGRRGLDAQIMDVSRGNPGGGLCQAADLSANHRALSKKRCAKLLALDHAQLVAGGRGGAVQPGHRFRLDAHDLHALCLAGINPASVPAAMGGIFSGRKTIGHRRGTLAPGRNTRRIFNAPARATSALG